MIKAPPSLLIATGNAGKVKEIEALLGGLPLRLLFLKDYSNITLPAETGSSYAENALIKARSYAIQTGSVALADDSGLEVAALKGAPGLRSARFGGCEASDDDRVSLLLSELEETQDRERRARFVCVMAIVAPTLRTMNVSQGLCEGRIAETRAGSGGFGFDPIFVPDGYRMTFAELPIEVKDRISHRAQALRSIRDFLTQLLKRDLTSGLTDS